MKNIRLNDTTYEGISKVQLPIADGGTASFKDEDEIVDPVLKTDMVITPTTEPQNIPVPDGFDGFDEFTVEAVTAAIDSNIVAGNIKKNVEILGVTGTLDTGSDPVLKTDLVITPATEPQNIPVPSGYDGFGALEVDAVTAAIDANIAAGNIKKNVEILGVTGSYEGETPAPKTPTIQVAQSGLITVSGDGIVTTTHQLSEADDPDFAKANIAKDVAIFGKVGTLESGGGGDPTHIVDPAILAAFGYTKLGSFPFTTVSNNAFIIDISSAGLSEAPKSVVALYSGNNIATAKAATGWIPIASFVYGTRSGSFYYDGASAAKVFKGFGSSSNPTMSATEIKVMESGANSGYTGTCDVYVHN